MTNESQVEPTGKSGSQAPTLACVIPLVHPEGSKITDYGIVEEALKATLVSLGNATSVKTVVVCHKLPSWHEAFKDLVTFLLVSPHQGFTANRNHKFIDKAMKYTIGAWYSLQAQSPKYIMPMDGDDYIRSDVVEQVNKFLEGNSSDDGLLVRHGYHVGLKPEDGVFAVNVAVKIRGFNRSCGTCRIMNARALRAKLEEHVPNLSNFNETAFDADENSVEPALLDNVVAVGDESTPNEEGFMHTFGGHMEQHRFFKLKSCQIPLAAKGCGHGNHEGFRGGAIHWKKALKLLDVESFFEHFGLQGYDGVTQVPMSREQVEQLARRPIE